MRERLAFGLIGVVSLGVVLVVGVLLLGPRAGPPAGPGAGRLPAVNAFLNGTSAVLLATGYVFIRRGNVAAHRACMLTAFGVSTLFLLSYVAYHAQAGSRPFAGQGWIRPVYFTLLVSHVLLAAVILPFVLTTIYRAWRRDFTRHVRLARWTLPVWMYVSVTGVIVYWMLYHLVPAR